MVKIVFYYLYIFSEYYTIILVNKNHFFFQFIGTRQKQMILKVFKTKILEYSILPEKPKYEDLIKSISNEISIG